MIPVACLTLIVVTLIAVLYAQGRAHAQELERVAVERRELLNRVQRPEHVPIGYDPVELPEQEPDEWNLVGTINRDPVPGDE